MIADEASEGAALPRQQGTWQVYLVGEPSDLDELSRVLQSPALKIEKDTEGYLLSSSRFARLRTEMEVRAAMENLLPLVNGAARLALELPKRIEATHVALAHPDGRKHVYVRVTETLQIRHSVSTTKRFENGTVEHHGPGDPIARWLEVAEKDPAAAKALAYAAADMRTWKGLYDLFEIIKEDLGSEKEIETRGYASRDSIRRFRHSANSPVVSGMEARHSVEPGAPPARPMSLSEARSMVKALLCAWLADKSSSSP